MGFWLVFSMQVLGTWIVDDAFISFRYAQNLLDGQGLVFNAGERVEGYTNFLWTIVIAGVMVVGADPILGAATITLCLAFLGIILTMQLAQHLIPAGWAWVAGSLVSLSGPFLLYTSRGSGMETGLVAVLTIAVLLALIKERWSPAGLLTVLLVLARPDGVLLAVAGGIYSFWVGWQSPMHRFHPLLRFGAPVVALYGPYFLWRWHYYGFLLPNTFYAKVGTTPDQVWRGIAYVWAVCAEERLILSGGLGLLLGWGTWQHWQRLPRPPVLIAGFLALSLGYIASVGGDWVPGARFGVPLLAPAAILTMWGLVGFAQCSYRTRFVSIMLLLVLIGLLAVRLPEESAYRPASGVHGQIQRVRQFREIGRWIADHTPPESIIATSAAGAIPYYAARPTIDVLGLTDAHIAHTTTPDIHTGLIGHEKTDTAYVLGRRPTIIIPHATAYLTDMDAIKAAYHLERFEGPEGRQVKVYLRRIP